MCVLAEEGAYICHSFARIWGASDHVWEVFIFSKYFNWNGKINVMPANHVGESTSIF